MLFDFLNAALPEVRHPEFLSYKSQYMMREGAEMVEWWVAGSIFCVTVSQAAADSPFPSEEKKSCISE